MRAYEEIPGPPGTDRDDGREAIAQAGGLHTYQLRLHAEYGPVARFRLPGVRAAVYGLDDAQEADRVVAAFEVVLTEYLGRVYHPGEERPERAVVARLPARGRGRRVLAAHHTTGVAVSWTLWSLARHPEAARHAVAEVDAVLGDRDAPGHDDLGACRTWRWRSRSRCGSTRPARTARARPPATSSSATTSSPKEPSCSGRPTTSSCTSNRDGLDDHSP
ncbi:cytochrome P450 [Spongiactinospora sp. TRM90649]|uniref:cytochrome P450 n=1 Tax=Spongiactinospora sp. TRM90649 TaxID=3031114 RepID=UPI0023F83A99|nr:cytochrome P450 [Spongiactinospora sp. TRM90649]MDF5754541.1 cytochrome P450 [Spongiactinospora sp. TRM90649]